MQALNIFVLVMFQLPLSPLVYIQFPCGLLVLCIFCEEKNCWRSIVIRDLSLDFWLIFSLRIFMLIRWFLSVCWDNPHTSFFVQKRATYILNTHFLLQDTVKGWNKISKMPLDEYNKTVWFKLFADMLEMYIEIAKWL